MLSAYLGKEAAAGEFDRKLKFLKYHQSFTAIREAYELLSSDERIPDIDNFVKEYDIQLSILRHKFEKIRTFKMLVR